MILDSSTLEMVHSIAGEELMPKNHIVQRAIALIYAVDRGFWVRSCDLCLVGGDPITLCLRLLRAIKETPLGGTLRISILHPGVFSGAPLAVLEDDDIFADFLRNNLIPTGLISEAVEPRRRVQALIDSLVAEVAAQMSMISIKGIFAPEFAQAGRDKKRDEIVLRLTRQKGVVRRDGHDFFPSYAMVDQITSVKGTTHNIFDLSRCLCVGGMSSLRKGVLRGFSTPPKGARYADILLTKRCEVLSGFLSIGDGMNTAPKGVVFMEEDVGADLFQFSRGAPDSLAEAVAKELNHD
jgi:hypothetical protein